MSEMAKSDINKLTGKIGVGITKQRRETLETVFREIDREISEAKKCQTPRTNGARTTFLEKYKVHGYNIAKEKINAKFNREVYNDTILKQWIEEDEAQK